jgi:hypothetical protein
MQYHAPPAILVQTWLQLLKSDMEPEAKRVVENKIVRVFGNVEFAIMYLEEKSKSFT